MADIDKAVPTTAEAPKKLEVTIPSVGDVKDKVSSFLENHWQTLLISLFAAVSVAGVAAMFIYYIMTRGSLRKKPYVVDGLKSPVSGTLLTNMPAPPVPADASEMTMSFWIYVQSFDRFENAYRHVFHRGGNQTDPLTSGPHVYFEKKSNQMHIAFTPSNPSRVFSETKFAGDGTTVSIPSTGTTTALKETRLEYMRKTRGITIDYIPIQRWVHVLVTANKRTNVLKAYVDGEEVKTVNNGTKVLMTYDDKEANLTPKIRDANLVGSGNIWVGGKPASNIGVGFGGLLSNLKFFDSVLTPREVYAEYRRGPIDSVMGRLGIPVYGVRSPIYPLTGQKA